MGCKVIGVDPHKRSHTAVVLDEDEEIAAQLLVAADRRQVEQLLAWADGWPQRIWAVENANGLGRLLSQQLVLAGSRWWMYRRRCRIAPAGYRASRAARPMSMTLARSRSRPRTRAVSER